MRHRLIFLILGLLVVSQPGLAAECPTLPSYDASHSSQKNEKNLLIVPGDSKPASPTLLASILLADQLALAKSLHPLPVSTKEDGNLRTDYRIDVTTEPLTSPSYRIQAVVTPKVPKKDEPAVRFEGSFTFPQTMNEALLSLSQKIATSLQSSLKDKQVLPYLYRPSSPDAGINYAQGRFLLDSLEPVTGERAKEAARYFDQAIKSDYNYVYAYLGLAESLVILGTMQGDEKLTRQADMQLMKAELLNPPMTKLKKGRIQWYRKQSCKNTQ